MTDTTDTPIQRAAKAYESADDAWLETDEKTPDEYHTFVARRVLTAALKVRWDALAIVPYHRAWLGQWNVGGAGPSAKNSDEFTAWADGRSLGDQSSIAEAKTAVERAVIEAIMGEKSE